MYELHQVLHLPFLLANHILVNLSVFQHLMVESCVKTDLALVIPIDILQNKFLRASLKNVFVH